MTLCMSAVFSPLSIVPLFDQLHRVSTPDWKLFRSSFLVVDQHSVFPSALLVTASREQTA